MASHPLISSRIVPDMIVGARTDGSRNLRASEAPVHRTQRWAANLDECSIVARAGESLRNA